MNGFINMFAVTYFLSPVLSSEWHVSATMREAAGSDWLRRFRESVKFAEITYVLCETVLPRLALISLKKQHPTRVSRRPAPGLVLSHPTGCEE